ncbi:MAG: TIR domain-containing protein [Candidatus Methanoperedens sp.]|nr:TIR domain-containing protein [Candidatus Methanoperedens sp.]
MIIKCKTCDGYGRFGLQTPFNNAMICPVCKGAGEFEINLPPEKIISCRYCNGNGILRPFLPILGQKPDLCPVCKGRGFNERPTVGNQTAEKSEIIIQQAYRSYNYDIAVSFAGEDRRIVEPYCRILSSKGLRVFYDEYEQVDLWGKNLYDKLDEIYQNKALFCVLFISKYYAAKVWTNHERKSAQARAQKENREYVLPVKLDDTEITGIPPTIGYIDIREVSVEKLAEITIQKVSNLKNRIR